MKLALVYDKDDHKLQQESYSGIYRGMMLALVDRFEEVQPVHGDCHADDIEADVIIFFDPQSSHHIRIDGIKKHSALKMEYMTDPHQKEVKGVYRQFNRAVHKLGSRQRLERTRERDVKYIISPVKEGYYTFFYPILGNKAIDMLFWFPTAPAFEPYIDPIIERRAEVLGNGAIWDGGLGAYEMRKWAFQQNYISSIPHWMQDERVPHGENYHLLLSQYAGALALSELYPVNKYFEIPMAGCLCFAQYHKEYEELGFEGYKTCIYVTKHNFELRIKDFLSRPAHYAHIAEAGNKLMSSKYTAKHFAKAVYDKVSEVKGCPTVQQVEQRR